MLTNKLSQTYAKALCDIAGEKGMLDKVETDLKQIEAVIRENPGLTNLLYHPRVPAAAKKETLNSVFGEDVDDFVKKISALAGG